MVGIVIGVVAKTGFTENGAWSLIEEPEVVTRNGYAFTPKVVCYGNDAPPVGSTVIAQGTASAKHDEYEGKHYAKLTLSSCRFAVLGKTDGGKQVTSDTAHSSDDDIPF